MTLLLLLSGWGEAVEIPVWDYDGAADWDFDGMADWTYDGDDLDE